jgi:hypothetical protein
MPPRSRYGTRKNQTLQTCIRISMPQHRSSCKSRIQHTRIRIRIYLSYLQQKKKIKKKSKIKNQAPILTYILALHMPCLAFILDFLIQTHKHLRAVDAYVRVFTYVRAYLDI